MNMHNLDSIILDLDGTLIDSMSVWYDVDRRFLLENGAVPPPGISEKVKRMSIEQAAAFFKAEFGLNQSVTEIINRIGSMVADAYAYEIPVKRGVREFLDFLDMKDIPYGVATATYSKLAKSVLERLGLLHRMKFVLTGEDVPVPKTSPDIFLECARLLGSPPERTLVVEDSLHCLETAFAAGFKTAAVKDRANEAEWERIAEIADFAVESIDELAGNI